MGKWKVLPLVKLTGAGSQRKDQKGWWLWAQQACVQ